MKQHRVFRIWIFTGSEAKQPTFRGAQLAPESWYVGHEAGSDIIAGPFLDERGADFAIDAITDTSGT